MNWMKIIVMSYICQYDIIFQSKNDEKEIIFDDKQIKEVVTYIL
jgi:hypothetical protein